MYKRSPAIAFAVAVALMTQSLHAGPATQPVADLPVKEVVLFSSGVGYFEHYGTINGDGSAELRFKTDQINDILKSLLLEDLDGGKVGTVSYPNPAPLARTLKSFGVDITNNPPLWDLLRGQLRFDDIPKSLYREHLHAIGVSATCYNDAHSVTFFAAHPEAEPWARVYRKGVRATLTLEHLNKVSAEEWKSYITAHPESFQFVESDEAALVTVESTPGAVGLVATR